MESFRSELENLENPVVEKDILELNSATCYTCGQELHADKKEEILDKTPMQITYVG
mgnify:CR=1 FL=1